MLTDIFAARYKDRSIWTEFRETDRILLVQAYRMVAEQLWPVGNDGKLDIPTTNAWKGVQNKLSIELGRESLAPLDGDYRNSNGLLQRSPHPIDVVCKTFMLEPYKSGANPDLHMKERISFIELAFRTRMEALTTADKEFRSAKKNKNAIADLDKVSSALAAMQSALSLSMERSNADRIKQFSSTCDELNERFRRAKVPLSYHNGYIQIAIDEMMQEQIERPFWELIADPKWANVATDMTEAIDGREANERAPAFWATRALESVIKIISAEKGWTHGRESGAHNYIDNLQSSKNGNFIQQWEAEALKLLFSKVRNPLGHGPGEQKMPELTQQQTDWVIETSMSWTKSLITRMH